MQYKYAREQQDYSDVSSGRVFYSRPGHPAFPVRLASEIFQRCLAHRETNFQISRPCTLYDPCCGAAYHLSVLGYLHRDHIRMIIGSDIDHKAVGLAEQNLGLLTMEGLDSRIRELSTMVEQYRKESHQEALRSALMLRAKLSRLIDPYPLTTRAFQASATNTKEISNHIQPKSVDIVFTDVPYGRHSYWRDSELSESSSPITSMLNTLLEVLSPLSIVAIASDKQQKVRHDAFQRLEQFQIGKRRVVLLRPINKSPLK